MVSTRLLPRWRNGLHAGVAGSACEALGCVSALSVLIYGLRLKNAIHSIPTPDKMMLLGSCLRLRVYNLGCRV